MKRKATVREFQGKAAEGPIMCSRPDIDVPGIKCGYPLPCPRHTAIIDASEDPVMVIVQEANLKSIHHLRELAKAIKESR